MSDNGYRAEIDLELDFPTLEGAEHYAEEIVKVINRDFVHAEAVVGVVIERREEVAA